MEVGKQRALFFYLDRLNPRCHLRGGLCQQQQHLADKTEADCKTYRDTFYFCSPLMCWLPLSLFRKSDPSGVFNEKRDFWILKIFWSLNGSSLQGEYLSRSMSESALVWTSVQLSVKQYLFSIGYSQMTLPHHLAI